MSTAKERFEERFTFDCSGEQSPAVKCRHIADVDMANDIIAFFRDELLKLAEEVEQGKKEHATGFSTATVKRKAHNKTLENVGALIRSKADELK